MKHNNFKILSIIFLLIIFALFMIPASNAKGPKTVAILPFTMNADRDLTFLQEGIMDMISSRLAWKGMVEVLEKGIVKKTVDQFKGPLNKEKALTIGKNLQVDYVILGSLTVFGESVSIDARILDVKKSEELITAFNQSKGMDEVIPTVNQFSQDINDKIMGRVVKPPVYARESEAPRGPGGLISEESGFEGKGPRHVQRLRFEIISMDTGDVNGDGKNELVFIDKDKVYVYRWQNKTFTQFSVIKETWSSDNIYVSVGDMDRNGRAEIYVTNLGEADVSSLVFEWDGNAFKKIASGQRWFFRVVDIPGQGRSLIGQRRETGGAFLGDVLFLNREGDRFVPAGPLKLPRFCNIYNFSFADLERTGEPRIVMLDHEDRLRLYNQGDREEIWRSNEPYGGTYNMFETGNILEKQSFIFISLPIYVTDLDEDGQKEVMVAQNHSRIGRFLGRARLFSGGTLRFLTWDKVGLSPKWTSKNQPGAIVGYRVIDVDNDGRKELIIASVTKRDMLLRKFSGKPRSQVVVYDLK